MELPFVGRLSSGAEFTSQIELATHGSCDGRPVGGSRHAADLDLPT